MAKIFSITEGLENMGALKTGGQGSVYKAKRIGEIISAVKLLPTPIYSESEDDKHFIDFQNEVNKLKRVNKSPNPNVVKILSSGITETGSLPFIEMEYIEGPDLAELLQSPNDPIFSIKEIIKVADQLSNALFHCHKADVKHGDIKANNVKFNINTGNYVLLDFGMAMMSDEQRRTSLRQAGAIEFMAPEQNEGEILFQTDVYSFGVILFELLGGTVPFPLADRGETARNNVMVAHMTTDPPDVLSLRRKWMPIEWSVEKKAIEMEVPEWLINTIYICLQKDPGKRFVNGEALHNYIVLRNTKTIASITTPDEVLQLQQEKQQLIVERDHLKQQLLLLANNGDSATPQFSTAGDGYTPIRKKKVPWLAIFLLPALIAAGIWLYKENKKPGALKNEKTANTPVTDEPREVKGQYKVLAARAYFYDQPDPATKRSAYMVPSGDIVNAQDDKDGFIYTEFTNSRGQTSKGWVRKEDIITLQEWNTRQAAKLPTPQDNINAQLAQARKFMDQNKTKDALNIYGGLIIQKVPEAMYEYGNLGLQNKNENIDCAGSYKLVEDAGDLGYAPAKKTLGFLFLFADNAEVLKINNYGNCEYKRNVFKGIKLLKDAISAGDSTAKRLLDELDIEQNFGDIDSLTN